MSAWAFVQIQVRGAGTGPGQSWAGWWQAQVTNPSRRQRADSCGHPPSDLRTAPPAPLDPPGDLETRALEATAALVAGSARSALTLFNPPQHPGRSSASSLPSHAGVPPGWLLQLYSSCELGHAYACVPVCLCLCLSAQIRRSRARSQTHCEGVSNSARSNPPASCCCESQTCWTWLRLPTFDVSGFKFSEALL